MTARSETLVEDEIRLIDQEVEALRRKSQPLRDALGPIDRQIRALVRRRNAKVAGRLGGRTTRSPRHDEARVCAVYQKLCTEGGRYGAFKATMEKTKIPKSSLQRILKRCC